MYDLWNQYPTEESFSAGHYRTPVEDQA